MQKIPLSLIFTPFVSALIIEKEFAKTRADSRYKGIEHALNG
jgi:hypothetical protein